MKVRRQERGEQETGENGTMATTRITCYHPARASAFRLLDSFVDCFCWRRLVIISLAYGDNSVDDAGEGASPLTKVGCLASNIARAWVRGVF